MTHPQQQKQAVSESDDIELDAFRPNYRGKCGVCDQSPTVQGVKDGEVVYDSGMCGPCTFGEACCIDPQEWNK